MTFTTIEREIDIEIFRGVFVTVSTISNGFKKVCVWNLERFVPGLQEKRIFRNEG